MISLLLAGALAAQAVSPTSNALTWVDPDTGVTFNVQRSTTGCGSAISFSAIATGLTVLTFTDGNLQPGTVYSYQVQAVRTSDGATVTSNCLTMTVAPPTKPTLTMKSK